MIKRKAMTLEQLLTKITNGELLDIQEELVSGVVPATGYAHSFCRKINRMIDQGKLCINPTTYRKVYLPTLAKAVQKELANRYTMILRGQAAAIEAAATEDSSCEQIALDLVRTNEQARMEV